MNTISRATRRVAVFGFRIFCWVIVLPLCKLIEPIWRIRVTPIFAARLGHLVLNTYFFVAERKLYGPEKRTWRIFFGARPCNRFLFDQWKSYLKIVESDLLSFMFMVADDILVRTPVFRHLPADIGPERVVNPFYVVDKSGPVFQMKAADMAKGREKLREMGIGPDDWFVCFQSRDAAYHTARGKDDGRFHRNSPIEDYLPAAEAITRRGGYAVRIGYGVTSALPELGNPKIIDYSTHFRDDFTDVFLLSQCRFFIAASTGTYYVPMLYGRQLVHVNQLPLVPSPAGRHNLYIPKLIRDRASGELVHFTDYFERVGPLELYQTGTTNRIWDIASTYENETVTLVNNSPDDIVAACEDMFEFVEAGGFSAEKRELQEFFAEKYFREKLPDVTDFGPMICPSFAAKYQHLIV